MAYRKRKRYRRRRRYPYRRRRFRRRNFRRYRRGRFRRRYRRRRKGYRRRDRDRTLTNRYTRVKKHYFGHPFLGLFTPTSMIAGTSNLNKWYTDSILYPVSVDDSNTINNHPNRRESDRIRVLGGKVHARFTMPFNLSQFLAGNTPAQAQWTRWWFYAVAVIRKVPDQTGVFPSDHMFWEPGYGPNTTNTILPTSLYIPKSIYRVLRIKRWRIDPLKHMRITYGAGTKPGLNDASNINRITFDFMFKIPPHVAQWDPNYDPTMNYDVPAYNGVQIIYCLYTNITTSRWGEVGITPQVQLEKYLTFKFIDDEGLTKKDTSYILP